MKRRVFITGGAHGIGKAIVEAFRSIGDIVIFCDIDEARGISTSEVTGARFELLDVRDVEALESCLQETVVREGGIDVIVNNVGIGKFKPLTELSVEEFDGVINTNLRAAFVTSRFMARERMQTNKREYGRIINICSSRYLQSEPGTEAYSASKGGIYSLTHALAMSFAGTGVTVNAIAPGWIHVHEDEVIRPEDESFHPSGRVGSAEDIARMCLFLCEPSNDFINGQTIVIDGGTTVKMIYPD